MIINLDQLTSILDWATSQPLKASALVASTAITLASAYYWHKGRLQLKQQSNIDQQPNPLPQSFNINSLEQNGYLLATRGKLLAQHLGVEPKIKLILAQSGLDVETCQWLSETFYALVEMVQLLPASQSHHHSGPGGLARHTIEVANIACRIRRGRLLPKGVSQEERTAEQHRWTVAIILAACLHDAGKVISDTQVDGLSRDGKQLRWNPSGGSMLDIGIDRYRVTFKEHDYSEHTQLGADLMPMLCPKPMMSWLGANASLMTALRAYLSGARDTTLEVQSISDIVTKADQASVKLDIGQGTQVRFNVVRTRPLIEILMESLNHLLLNDGFKINQSGGAAFVYESDIFMVSKTTADRVRDWITANRSSYLVSLPTDNERLFSTWQDFGQIVPTPDNKAIWTCIFEGINNNGKFKFELTVLRFPLHCVYGENQAAYPKQFAGSITIKNTWDKAAKTIAPTQAQTQSTQPDQPENVETKVKPSAKVDSNQFLPSEAVIVETIIDDVGDSLSTVSSDNTTDKRDKAPKPKVKNQMDSFPRPNPSAFKLSPKSNKSNQHKQAILPVTSSQTATMVDHVTAQTAQPVTTSQMHADVPAVPQASTQTLTGGKSMTTAAPESKVDAKATPDEDDPFADFSQSEQSVINEQVAFLPEDEDVRTTINDVLTKQEPVSGAPIKLPSLNLLSGHDNEPEPLTMQFIYWLQTSLANGSL
ncbi:MAG: TraI domain-containing protein, partial [Thiotrichales bacterium]|nr:TraI domain-containing protein [Thiotrichales bacterium]